MKFGISIFGMSPKMFVTVARKADELGFESMWVPEHLVFPAEIPLTYPYSTTGRPPINPTTPLFDPWVTLAYVAAGTERLRLGTSVYILPLRNPFVTARAVATLDRLSEGRAILGVGVGWLKEEFEAVGEGFDNRFDRTAEIIEIINRLWTEETIEFHGKHYSFPPVKFEPKPVQKPRPPIEFGGETPAALRRAARWGDGWIGAGQFTLEQAQDIVKRLNGARVAAGRQAQPFEISMAVGMEPTADNLRRYGELGVTRVMLRAPFPRGGRVQVQDLLDYLERFAREVMPRV